MKRKHQSYLINLIFPAVVFGGLTGILTALVVNLYKFCAREIIHLSETGYHALRGRLYLLPIVLGILLGVAFLFAYIYKKIPNLRGGGIPTSIGILRGIIPFKWIRNLIGVFALSLFSFLVGVPLDNEGASVQMGTAIGRGSVFFFAKKHRAWDRYSMTGGACAGFSVATGAPISGIMFAIEEAHQRISPMIVIVASVAVLFAQFTTLLLSSVFHFETALFPHLELKLLSFGEIWLPLAVGITVGLFSVLFLKYYRVINAFFHRTLKKLHHGLKIWLVFAATVLLGLCSYSFLSTGHELILSLFEGTGAVWMLLLLLVVRATLTLCANTNRITGGICMPLLVLGVLLSAVLARLLTAVFGLGQEYYSVLLVFGITACFAGMMKMPLTAIFFSWEALSCDGNILYVIVVSAVAYIITELFEVKSINDIVVDTRVEEQNEGKTFKVIDTFVTVKKDAFAIGKQIRDIFWPANLFVLSLKHPETRKAEVDRHGGKEIEEGDVLHVRYSTYDESRTRAELISIVGEQSYHETETTIV